MDQHEKRITAADLAAMTPNERFRVIEESVITDWADIPKHFQDRIIAEGKRLVREGLVP